MDWLIDSVYGFPAVCVFVLGDFNDLDYPYGSRTVATYNVMMNYLYAPPTKVGGI
jgi:hypothetical protein